MNHQANGMMEAASGSGGGRRPGGGWEGRKDHRPDFDEDDDDDDEDADGADELFAEFENDPDFPQMDDDPDDYTHKGSDCSRFLRYYPLKGAIP